MSGDDEGSVDRSFSERIGEPGRQTYSRPKAALIPLHTQQKVKRYRLVSVCGM